MLKTPTPSQPLSSIEISKQTFYGAVRQAYRYPSLWASSEQDSMLYTDTQDHYPFKYFHWRYSDVLTHPSSHLSAIYLLYWQHTIALLKEDKVRVGDVVLRLEEFDQHLSFGEHQELSYFTRLLGSIKDDSFTPSEELIYGAQAFLLQKTTSVPVTYYNATQTDYCFKFLVNAHFSQPVTLPDSYSSIGEFLLNEYYSCVPSSYTFK
jgi:hypothetical protein